MHKKPQVSVNVDSDEEAIALFEEAIGEHYDVRLGDEVVESGDETLYEPVIRIFDKESGSIRLSVWISR